MSYTYLGGTGSDSTYHLRMFVYPDTKYERWEAHNTVKDALSYFGDQLHAGDAITKWSLYSYDYYPRIEEDNAYDYRLEFRDWVPRDLVGVHLALCDNFANGIADGGDAPGWTGFSRRTHAVAGVSTSASRYMNTAIQETAHPVINNDLDIVESMLTHNDDEHELGKIYWDDDASPMTSGYGTDTSKYGTCDSGEPYNGESHNITNCTNEAVKYTARDER